MWCNNAKAKKLMELGASVIKDETHSNELQHLMDKLSVKESDVLKAYIDYDLDIFAYDNEIYQPLITRLILHMHNLLKRSWHIDRQQSILKFIKQAMPTKVIDLGFGVPSFYISDCLISKSFHVTLCDHSPLAFSFARELLDFWDKGWQKIINFLQADIMNVQVCVGDYDLYIFQDSIEHVTNLTQCLTEFVALSNPNAKFLLSLPLGPIIPMHKIAWKKQEEAFRWLRKCGLQPLHVELVRTNPEVDLFASSIEGGFTEFVVICDKI